MIVVDKSVAYFQQVFFIIHDRSFVDLMMIKLNKRKRQIDEKDSLLSVKSVAHSDTFLSFRLDQLERRRQPNVSNQ